MDDTKDTHAGMGGSYLLDPATGLRTLVERTDWTSDQPASYTNPTVPTDPLTGADHA